MTLWQEHAHLCETDPEATNPIFFVQHLRPYHFVRDRVAGQRVLEIGIGSAYGTSVLAETAVSVVGVDIAPGNITRAQARYPKANLRFERMRGEQLAFPNAAFDAVVSFQVIEHVPKTQLSSFLSEIKRVLTPEGTAYISTLNVEFNRKPGQPYEKNIYHEREFTALELKALMLQHFASVELWGLHPSWRHRLFRRLKRWGAMRWAPAVMNPITQFYRQPGIEAYELRLDGAARSTDMLAVGRNA